MSTASTPSRRGIVIAVLLMAFALTLFSAVVIRDFNGPIGDHVESFLYEYLSYYTSKNLTFTPLPHLNLENDQVFYPYGTVQALQSFCVERDLLFTLLTRYFGRGPWLQVYYLLGLTISTFGTFALLRPRNGEIKAGAAAIAANLLNYYGAQKYPYHFNIAVVHWTTLSIICDFVIFQSFLETSKISVKLVSLRGLLTALSFGLELGHILGYSLTSLLFTFICMLAVALQRTRRQIAGGSSLRAIVAQTMRPLRRDLVASWTTIITISVVTCLVSLLYAPIVIQLVRASRHFNFDGVVLGAWWSNPVRLFIPYTPWLHPSQQPRFLRIGEDQAEVGIGSGGAGLALLGIAVLGIVGAKRRGVFVPGLVAMTIYIVSRPTFDLLRWMPWFAFTRVFSRATVVYSTYLALLGLGLDWSRIALRVRVVGLTLFFIVLGVELVTFRQIKMTFAAFTFDRSFHDHMHKIEELPGEAVLDFPFCILGGNGDAANLCPYMERLKSVYALQRFHHKKVIGQYLGRVHPSQTKPFVDAGWPTLWDPDDVNPITASVQTRCLTTEEWTFFTQFYMKNNFSGIQLATDRLPASCVQEFYTRFGQPMGVVEIPKAGHLAFIARPARSFDLLDPVGGRNLRVKIEPILEHEIELVSARRQRWVQEHGISGYESLQRAGQESLRWRWALAPASSLEFESRDGTRFELGALLMSPIAGQAISIDLDGKQLASWTDLPVNVTVARRVDFIPGAGQHTIKLAFAVSNTSEHAFAPTDPRPLAVRLDSLVLRPMGVAK
jgi:hypothetical protein